MASGPPDLLKGLSDAQAEQLLALGERVRLGSGQRLFGLGEEARSLHLIERGRIVLTLPMQVQGQNQDVFVEERLPGQALGWSALIGQRLQVFQTMWLREMQRSIELRHP